MKSTMPLKQNASVRYYCLWRGVHKSPTQMTIVEELRNDRESGARRLESEYKAGLMILARRLYADPSDAEELVNRTFAAVVEGIDGFLEQSSLFTWMCRILNHIYSMDNRRKSNQMVVSQGDLPDVEDDGAQEEVYRNLDASLVRDAIGLLPPDQRETLLLHYFMDIPVAKMAKILAVPVGTVHSRLHYARKALAAKLGVKAHEMARKPGARALLVALALAALTAVGAAVAVVEARVIRPQVTHADEPSALRKNAAAVGGIAYIPDVPDSNAGKTGMIGNAADSNGFPPTNSTPQQKPAMNTSLRTLAASAALAAATGATAPTLADPVPATSSSSSELVAMDARTRTEATSEVLTNFSSSPVFATTLFIR